MKKYHFLTQIFLLILIVSSCKKDASSQNIDTVPHAYDWKTFEMGTDLSYVNAVEDYGGVYLDSNKVKDPFIIFKSHGANLVRVRLWHNPQWTSIYNNGHIYSDLFDVEKTIRRAKNAGMVVNLDLHYSDTWADPNNQTIPAAWNGLNLPNLKDSVYHYTLSVLQYLASKGLTPEMVQIGNETNVGMLWPTGKVVNNDFSSFGVLLQAGIKAVRDFSKISTIQPQIMLHVAQLQNADWYANGVIKQAQVTDFDILGISHYIDYTTITTMNQVSGIIKSLKTKYNKKIMLAEVAYPWTTSNADSYPNISNGSLSGYPLTPTGQYAYMKDLTQQVIDGGGTGIMYWEPAWITSTLKDQWGTGSSWDNNTLFDFKGNTLPAINYMNYSYKF